MKICVTSAGKSNESSLDPRFGRCAYFIIADSKTGEYTAISNESGAASAGAGISSGQIMVENKIEALITGNVGPNAMSVLKAANMAVYKGVSDTVKRNIEKLNNGELEQITQTVPSHFGMKNRSNN